MVAGLAGNAEAYHQLLEAVAQRLRVYFTRRAGADCAALEDLVQEMLIAIHRKRASYDRMLPLTAWLYAIARYKLLDHMRQHGVRKTVPLETEGEIADAEVFEACLTAAEAEK